MWSSSSDNRRHTYLLCGSCDIGQHQKQFLLLQSQVLDSSAGCVFSDLLDRLPATTRDWIQSASPTKDMPVEEAQAANALVREFVSSQEPLFTSMADAYCHMHRQRCPVFPGWALQRMASTNQASNQSVENRCLNFSPEKKRKQAQRSTPWYEKPASSLGFADSEDDKASDLVVCNIAGLVCTDCTPLGVRKGMCGAGVTEPVHEVWRAEREFLARQSLEDWYFTENSSAYRVEQKQVSDLKKTHDVKHITICPTQLGFPIRRRRMFSFGFDKSRWVWVGKDDVQADYESLFGASCCLSGDVYLQAGQQEIKSFVENEAARRKTTLPQGFQNLPMSALLTQLLPPGAIVRKGQYDRMRANRESLTGNFLADLQRTLALGLRVARTCQLWTPTR